MYFSWQALVPLLCMKRDILEHGELKNKLSKAHRVHKKQHIALE